MMLSERYYQLLTAYVDGELSARQRKGVVRLLERSAEARALLEQLRADAEALRRLPRRGLAADFPDRVLRSIHARGLNRRRLARPQPQPVPAWVGIALAASVLFLIGFGSFFYFALTLPDRNSHAEGPPPYVPDDTAGPEAAPKAPAGDVPKAGGPPATARDKPRPEPAPPPAPVAKTPEETPGPPKAPAAAETAQALPVPEMEMFPPQPVNVAVSATFKLRDLDGPRLCDELRKDSGFRLEAPCPDTARAFERLQAAFKAHGVGLLVEPNARDRLKGKLQTNLVLYIEGLLPDELAGILQQAGGEDRKAESKHHGDGQFGGLVVTRLSKGDRKELAALLGVDPGQVAAPGPGLDPKKPLAEDTAEHLTRTLAGHGGASRTQPNTPAARAAEHLALVLPYNPVRPRANSDEVKRFLASRKPPRGGTVAVLLVLRGVRG
jgi:hypothetical protein